MGLADTYYFIVVTESISNPQAREAGHCLRNSPPQQSLRTTILVTYKWKSILGLGPRAVQARAEPLLNRSQLVDMLQFMPPSARGSLSTIFDCFESPLEPLL